MPTDLTTERTQREHRRYALTIRHVHMAATPDEARTIRRLIAAVQDGSLQVADAHALLRTLQRDQQERAAYPTGDTMNRDPLQLLITILVIVILIVLTFAILDRI